MDKKIAQLFSRSVFSPSEFISEELNSRGWSIEYLATQMGFTKDYVDRLVRGESIINLHTSRALGAAFGTSSDFWLNLEKDYQEHKRLSYG